MSETYTDLNLTNFPQAVDAQSVMQDPSTVEDMEAIAQYQEAMQSGNIQSALSMLASNEKLSAMCLNAIKFNRHEHMIIALERMFLEDIETYIAACREAASPELTAEINNIKNTADSAMSKANSLETSFTRYKDQVSMSFSGVNQKMKGMVRVESSGIILLRPDAFSQNEDGMYEATISFENLTTKSRMCWSLTDEYVGKVMIAGLKCVNDGKLTIVCLTLPDDTFTIEYSIESVVK